ncbi:hypothetical protein N7470_007199 [Penicillium chermesinum]|nr:hypothetical protein N7470_007199 [Penicillium chermesinum]
MDLASLTRPAILSQCVRCSSSLAALENEWAKLSNTYSIPVGWQSINLQRISVSSDKRQIPQTSEMIILRGRIIQEVSCKLCQQKLGVLCMLDDGPNVLWKMTKISFREIITMRTAEPVFTEAALERQRPIPKEPIRRGRTTSRDAALMPSGLDHSTTLAPTMQQEMHHQGRSIDQISSSVNHLQDTMTDLKHSFNSLRIELNAPTRHMGDSRDGQGHGFDMIATVLKELKSKSEEIEKLKLEIEALKFKNRFMEDRKPGSPENLSVMDGAVPVKSPEMVQAGRKRAWPDAFSSRHIHPIPDSFGEDDGDDDFSIGDLPSHADLLVIRDTEGASQSVSQPHPAPLSPNPRVDPRDHSVLNGRDPNQSPAKRLRLTAGNTSAELPVPEKRRPGRPRKSTSQPTNPQFSEGSNAASEIAMEASSTIVPIQNSASNHTQDATKGATQHRRRSRSRRSMHSQPGGGPDINERDETVTIERALQNGHDRGEKIEKPNNGNSSNVSGKHSHTTETEEEMRKAKIAARETMTRIAMQREEAMEAD